MRLKDVADALGTSMAFISQVESGSKLFPENFKVVISGGKWWAMKGLNLRPHPCKGCALPTELIARKSVVLLEAADELIIVD